MSTLELSDTEIVKKLSAYYETMSQSPLWSKGAPELQRVADALWKAYEALKELP